MKITAGLGSIEEYIPFMNAGADEFFCGYVPYFWTKKYGTVMPLNRREVLNYNVQLGSYSELEILSAMIRKYKKPVHLTFNSLYYIPEQYPEIAEIIQRCMLLGFRSYIVADPALIVYLRSQNINCDIHLSGETGEINSCMVEALQKLKLKRVIFHRKNSFEDMEAVIQAEKKAGGERAKTEFEAFVLNEMCQFTGAFCNSLHCDEMGYLCRVPYHLGAIRTGEKIPQKVIKLQEAQEEKEVVYDETGYLCGESGCGLCALYRLLKAGITHMKLVGRGNYTEHMEKDIRNLKRARDILKSAHENAIADTEKIFQQNMKNTIFPYGCSGNCYYNL